MFPSLRLREAWRLGGLSVSELVVRTWNRINENEIMTRAAAVSFYAMLALVPFLTFVLTLSVRLLPEISDSPGMKVQIGTLTVFELDRTLEEAFPPESYQVVHDQIVHLRNPANTPPGLLLLSLSITVWLASSLFVAVIDAMNRIYGVVETRSFLKVRVVALMMTWIQAAILVGSLLVIVLWPQILKWTGLSLSSAWLATIVQWTVVSISVMLSFDLALYVGPDADQRWEWITPGSVVGTALFLASSFGFRIYVQHFADYDKTYGSLGGVMVLLFWFWISSLILLASAQVNMIIEEASPLGKSYGQKVDQTEAPDLKAIAPTASKAP